MALAATTLLAAPAGLWAQATAGPAVVPPGGSYVEPSAAEGLQRWKTRPGVVRVIRVFLEPPPASQPEFWRGTLDALRAWSDAPDLPLRFQLVEAPDEAEVRFRWIDEFSSGQAGMTDWQTDAEGWLRGATVTLALRHAGGLLMSREYLRLVALHETGHVIGMPHSEDPGDVMHPGNRNPRLSQRDVHSARLLYAVLPRGPAPRSAGGGGHAGSGTVVPQ